MLQSAVDYNKPTGKVWQLRSFLRQLRSLLFSSLRVSYSSTVAHLSAWAKLWDRLLEEPQEPRYFIDTADTIENSLPSCQAKLDSTFIEAIKRAQGRHNGR